MTDDIRDIRDVPQVAKFIRSLVADGSAVKAGWVGYSIDRFDAMNRKEKVEAHDSFMAGADCMLDIVFAALDLTPENEATLRSLSVELAELAALADGVEALSIDIPTMGNA